MRPHTIVAASIVLVALVAADAASAQSREDKRASLAGLTNIAIKETGVAALGGGTAGSPYLLQVEKPFKAAGIHVADYDGAAQKGIPIYELLCSSMDGSDATIRVACEGRLVRTVNVAPDKSIYAVTWTSPLVVATLQHDDVAALEKLTQKFVDGFMEDWTAANPSSSPKSGKRK